MQDINAGMPLSIDAIVTAASPDSVGLLAQGANPLCYRDLAANMSIVAGAVRRAGIRREDRVALILPDGPDLAIAFLGVASSAICAPLNPAYSVPEFESYLAGLDVRAAIVAPGRPNALAALERLRIPIIEFPRLDQRGDIDAAPEHANPDDVALILQTSGTTSRPKVVPLTHRNLCVSAANVARVLELTASDRCLEIMPLFHIHGIVAGLLAPLISGGSVVCTPGFSAAGFFASLDEFQTTWYTAVPTMHQAILARSEMHRDVIERHRLRLIRSSSAALPPSVLKHLEQTFGAPVVEAYGMTEAAHQMASNLPGRRKAGTVGFPAGPEIAIMNEQGSILEAGVCGEIVIRGDNVTRGYEDNAPANEAGFLYGWFHTGDQGFFDLDGYLVISGRIKEIINRGGEKISPREIDEVLLQHPSVAEAVTFAIPHRQLGEAVGVAVVNREGATVTEIEIREFAAARLAHFKIPEVVRFVPGIPRAATGKIQRIGMAAKLGIEEIDGNETEPQAAFVQANTALEAELQTIWSEILKISPVGIHDNFFALGGGFASDIGFDDARRRENRRRDFLRPLSG
jgi:oxalate---CoA ligase